MWQSTVPCASPSLPPSPSPPPPFFRLFSFFYNVLEYRYRTVGGGIFGSGRPKTRAQQFLVGRIRDLLSPCGLSPKKIDHRVPEIPTPSQNYPRQSAIHLGHPQELNNQFWIELMGCWSWLSGEALLSGNMGKAALNKELYRCRPYLGVESPKLVINILPRLRLRGLLEWIPACFPDSVVSVPASASTSSCCCYHRLC